GRGYGWTHRAASTRCGCGGGRRFWGRAAFFRLGWRDPGIVYWRQDVIHHPTRDRGRPTHHPQSDQESASSSYEPSVAKLRGGRGRWTGHWGGPGQVAPRWQQWP